MDSQARGARETPSVTVSQAVAVSLPAFGDACPGPMGDGMPCPNVVEAIATYNEGTSMMCEQHFAVSQFLRLDGNGGLERYEPVVERPTSPRTAPAL